MKDKAQISASDAVSVLRTARLRASNESALQGSIAEALGAAGIGFTAEVKLDARSRIDFMLEGGIGIEAKVKYPKRAIFRQLERYAAIGEVTALILVTGTAMGLPAQLNGKPLFYVSLGRAAL